MKRLIVFYLFLIASYAVVTKVVLKQPEVNRLLDKGLPTTPKQVIQREFPQEKQFEFPVEYLPVHEKFQTMYNGLSSSLALSGVPVVVIPDFAVQGETTHSSLPHLMAVSAYEYLLPNRKIRLLVRDYHSKKKTRIKSTYVLIGKMNSLEDMFHVTVRLENSSTGEIIEVFDDYIEKTSVASFL